LVNVANGRMDKMKILKKMRRKVTKRMVMEK
jgi:hypothetical protein